MTALTRNEIDTESFRRELGSTWGWLVALGVALLALGVFAFLNLVTATRAAVYIMGVLMIIAAVFKIVGVLRVRTWSGFAWYLFSALLYGAAGVIAVSNPTLGAQALTLALAFALMLSGGTRIWWAAILSPMPGAGWITASGIVSVVAGVVFLIGWPANTVYLLGLVLAIDLMFQGASLIGWGATLKRLSA